MTRIFPIPRHLSRLGGGVALLMAACLGCSSDKDPTQPDTTPDPNAAVYTLRFESTWSAATHPEGFPEFPHLSGLIGGTHASSVSFWEVASQASPGIQNMAETGSKEPLQSEVQAAITGGTAGRVISDGGIGQSPGVVEATVIVDPEFPLVTVVSMIAPSPDWFVGVHGLSLRENGSWVDSLVVDLYAYDAGTDSGVDYVSANAPTTPHEPIVRIDRSPFRVGDQVPKVGTFLFIRN